MTPGRILLSWEGQQQVEAYGRRWTVVAELDEGYQVTATGIQTPPAAMYFVPHKDVVGWHEGD